MVEGLIGPKSHGFGARPADTRRFLEAVSAKAIDEEGVFDLGMGTEDGILVRGVELEEAGPRAHRLDLGEGWHPFRQQRPDAILLVAVVHIKIDRAVILGYRQRYAADSRFLQGENAIRRCRTIRSPSDNGEAALSTNYRTSYACAA